MDTLYITRSRVSTSKFCPKNSLITIATQLSIDRIDRLARLCEQWRGPIVAAILEEVRGNYDEIYQAARRYPDLVFGCDNQSIKSVKVLESSVILNTMCSLKTLLLRRKQKAIMLEPHLNELQYRSDLYPINELRNAALCAVETEFVLLLDVDCSFCTNAVQKLTGACIDEISLDQSVFADRLATLRRLCIDSFSVIVIPCLEQVPSNAEDQGFHATESNPNPPIIFTASEVPGFNASGCLKSDSDQQLQPFMAARFSRAHRATQFDKLRSIWQEDFCAKGMLECNISTHNLV